MDNNKIRRIIVATASAALLTAGLGFATPASAVVGETAVFGETATEEAEEGKGYPGAQHGVVTAPVVTDGKEGDVVTVFKVTDETRTVPWAATSATVVLKRGARVPASEIAQGDRVTAINTPGGKAGAAASARRVIIHDGE
ncbi:MULTISPECIES: hypothetical protein [Saccharothrix]|uniref:hypothetical protein n=1 Tax=Saccharothrix TaxID=2071 RepID=UPI00093C864F|nr:hypothetical protein [Saccharothrix sp. CB00851]OKI15419.1 hypothetical protein A6A25_13985 [Saccharothrix sp. CB00851]